MFSLHEYEHDPHGSVHLTRHSLLHSFIHSFTPQVFTEWPQSDQEREVFPSDVELCYEICSKTLPLTDKLVLLEGKLGTPIKLNIFLRHSKGGILSIPIELQIAWKDLLWEWICELSLKCILQLKEMRRWPIPGTLRAYFGMSLPSASNLTKAAPGNGGFESDTTKKWSRRNNGFNI